MGSPTGSVAMTTWRTPRVGVQYVVRIGVGIGADVIRRPFTAAPTVVSLTASMTAVAAVAAVAHVGE